MNKEKYKELVSILFCDYGYMMTDREQEFVDNLFMSWRGEYTEAQKDWLRILHKKYVEKNP